MYDFLSNGEAHYFDIHIFLIYSSMVVLKNNLYKKFLNVKQDYLVAYFTSKPFDTCNFTDLFTSRNSANANTCTIMCTSKPA